VSLLDKTIDGKENCTSSVDEDADAEDEDMSFDDVNSVVDAWTVIADGNDAADSSSLPKMAAIYSRRAFFSACKRVA